MLSNFTLPTPQLDDDVYLCHEHLLHDLVALDVAVPFLAGRAHLCANRCTFDISAVYCSKCTCQAGRFVKCLVSQPMSLSHPTALLPLASWATAFNPDESFLLMSQRVASHASRICMPWLERLLGQGQGGSRLPP